MNHISDSHFVDGEACVSVNGWCWCKCEWRSWQLTDRSNLSWRRRTMKSWKNQCWSRIKNISMWAAAHCTVVHYIFELFEKWLLGFSGIIARKSPAEFMSSALALFLILLKQEPEVPSLTLSCTDHRLLLWMKVSQCLWCCRADFQLSLAAPSRHWSSHADQTSWSILSYSEWCAEHSGALSGWTQRVRLKTS